MVLTREQVRELLREAAAEVFGLGVRRLALFGSVLRNDARPDSDVDLLVEFSPGQKSFDRFLALSGLLETLLGHPVELVHHGGAVTLADVAGLGGAVA